MTPFSPASADEMCALLKDSAERKKTIAVFGNNSKRLMAGPIIPTDIAITTQKLRKIVQYERDDLTVSVQAGMPFAELQTLLAREGQMIALDPPFHGNGTVGGVLAANLSGPMRRAFGTARDLCIGMSFATLEGHLVKTGGMVVKNVAGLDMGKLMIGSFGTLAILTSVNFRVHALPQTTRTFLFSYADLNRAIEKRDQILKSPLKPLAIDLLSPPAAARLARRGFVVAIRAEGSKAVMARYGRELSEAEPLPDNDEKDFWSKIREFTPEFLNRQPAGVVLKISTTLTGISDVFRCTSGACISRAGSGVSYLYLTSWPPPAAIWNTARERGWSLVVEFAPDEVRKSEELWLLNSSPVASDTFAIMERVKTMFDSGRLLNRSRLYGRI